MPISPPSAHATHVFAYGTLAVPDRLDEVLGHKHLGERMAAQLNGFKRVESSTYEFPYIVEADGHTVQGVLLMDLSPDDMRALNRYEEVEKGVYRPETVVVLAWGCGPRPARMTAVTYVAGDRLTASTTP